MRLNYCWVHPNYCSVIRNFTRLTYTCLNAIFYNYNFLIYASIFNEIENMMKICLLKTLLQWTYIEILITYNIKYTAWKKYVWPLMDGQKWLIDWLFDWFIDWLTALRHIRAKKYCWTKLINFCKKCNQTNIKSVTGRLTAHQHINTPMTVNNVIIITLRSGKA